MRSASALRLALACTALLGVRATAQESGQVEAGAVDWPARVKAAIESPRYAVQRAASNQIGRAGDAAVLAVRAYMAEHGKDRLPMLLVDAIAQAKTGGEPTTALLREWASDSTFYWRAQALTGLALRADEADADLFTAALADPSHLFRVAGAKGVHALAARAGEPWDAAKAVLADPDPRARVMFALYLWERRELAARAVLVAAVADDRSFLDDDWGRKYAVQAFRALASAAKTDFGYAATKSLADNRDAIAAMAKWAEIEMPPLRERSGVPDLGGVEIRSCRAGDLFVRWTADEIHFGLERDVRVPLAPAARGDLTQALERAAREHGDARAVFGSVVCDYVQVTLREPARLWKMAPGAVPPDVESFLRALAAALHASDAAAMAREIEQRLPQFTERG